MFLGQVCNGFRLREQQAVDKVHSNPKYFYSYAKKFSKQKRSIPMLFNEAKRTCTNPEVIANILQRQFSSVFSDPSATNINDALFQSPSIKKPFIDDMLAFSVADIMEAIDEIRPGAAAGPDDLPALLLKKCKEALSKPIHMIWQHSMSTRHQILLHFTRKAVVLLRETTDLCR